MAPLVSTSREVLKIHSLTERGLVRFFIFLFFSRVTSSYEVRTALFIRAISYGLPHARVKHDYTTLPFLVPAFCPSSSFFLPTYFVYVHQQTLTATITVRGGGASVARGSKHQQELERPGRRHIGPCVSPSARPVPELYTDLLVAGASRQPPRPPS